MQSSLLIHLSRWIVPINTPIIEDGAIVQYKNKIVDLGPRHEILAKHSGKIIDLNDAIICPGLVNSHCHVELSYLKGRITSFSSFADWIRKVIQLKSPPDANLTSHYIQEMKKRGICAVLDVGNDPVWLNMYSLKEYHNIKKGVDFFIHLNEIIDPKGEFPQTLKKLPQYNTDLNEYSDNFKVGITPHSTYSVHPKTIMSIKKLANKHQITSIHLSESLEENEFVKYGTGKLKDLFIERGHWPLNYIPSGLEPIFLLHKLGFLDNYTILVHGIYLNYEGIKLIKKNNCTITICPRSNILLAGKIIDVIKLLENKINICLGTDSLASNEKLCIFSEMRALKRLYPQIPSQEILKFATINGAKALKLHDKIGSLEKGKNACYFAIIHNTKLSNEDVYDFLVEEMENLLEKSKFNCLFWLNQGEV